MSKMIKKVVLRLSVLVLCLNATGFVATVSQAADKLSREVGKPLQKAQELVQGKKFKDALPLIDQAEKAGKGKLSEYEKFVIAQMRGAAKAGAGDAIGAAKAFEVVLASGRLSPAEHLNITEAVAGTYLRARQYEQAINWIKKYKKIGGTKPSVLGLLPQAYYFSGDYENSAREAAKLIGFAEKSGKKPTEADLKLLASSLVKLDNMSGYSKVLVKLVTYYPTPKYWADVIKRTAARPGFSRKLELDMFRLLRATDNMSEASDYMEATQLAIQAGLPGEARELVDEGFEKGLLGAGNGSETERENRLKKLVYSKYDEDKRVIASTDAAAAEAGTGDPLVKTGLAYVTYGSHGKGIQMMIAGIKKGELRHAEQAKLHLGYAYYLAGKKNDARKIFQAVEGDDGARHFARLWDIIASQ